MMHLLHNVWTELDMKLGKLLADSAFLRREHPPGSCAELHHRRECLDLAGADEQLVREALPGVEAGGETAANHIGEHIGLAAEPRNQHIRNDGRELLPTVAHIVQAHYQRQAAGLEARAVFVIRELQAHQIEGVAEVGRFHPRLAEEGILPEILRVSAVELEAVEVEALGHGLQFIRELFAHGRSGKVHGDADSAPPPYQGRFIGLILAAHQDVLAARTVVHIFGTAVGGEEIGAPEYTFVPIVVNLVKELCGIGEGVRIEVPAAMIALPAAVYHYHTAREAALVKCIYEFLGIFLIDTQYHSLNPVVELGVGEHQLGRFSSVEGEMLTAGLQIGLFQRFSGSHRGERLVFGNKVQDPFPELEGERTIAPDVAAFIGQQERSREALGAVQAQVIRLAFAESFIAHTRFNFLPWKTLLVGVEIVERLHIAFFNDGAPPVFAWKRFHRGGIGLSRQFKRQQDGGYNPKMLHFVTRLTVVFKEGVVNFTRTAPASSRLLRRISCINPPFIFFVVTL